MAVIGTALRLFVRRLKNHSRLSMDEHLAIISLEAVARVVKPNVDIVNIGELTDRACLIATGLVAWFAQLSDGRGQITTRSTFPAISPTCIHWSTRVRAGPCSLS